MKENRTDPYICIFVLVVFLFYFFVIGPKPLYYEEGELEGGIVHHSWELKGLEWSTIIFIGPVIFLMFMVFYVFRVELRDFTIRGSIRKAAGLARIEWKRSMTEWHQWRLRFK